MFPIPIFTIMTSTGVVPLPAGIVKKVITLDYPDNAGNSNSSLAILLNDGRLFTQGANLFGEIADGTRSARFNNFHLASTVVADVFTADRCFVIKTNSGGWQYSGLTAGLVGSIAAGGTDACVTTWTSFPSVITGTISLANLKEVKGGYNNTLWLMNSGVLYGSGQNTVGSLGASTTNEVSTPRQITSAAVAFDAGYNQCSYVNNVGTLRVCGASKGLAGNNNTTTAFVNATISTTETVYVKDYINTVSQTIVVGDTSGGTGTVNYLYVRSNTETTYTKLDTFAAGFSTWKFPPSRHSFFVGINNSLWAIGKNYTANLGLGYDSASGDPLQVGKPVKPEGVGSWDINKLTSVHTLNMDVTNQLGYQGTFFVYNGDMYYSGIWKDGKASYLFNSGLNYNKFTPIASSVITGDVLATSLTTDSLGVCIVGGTKQLTHSVSPEGGKLFNIKYTSSAPANMTISSTGLMTFHAEGGFDAGMTALNAEGTTLSDTSGGYASTLSVYTPSLSAMDVGTTQTMVAEITPTGAASLPGMVVEYFSNDPTVATVDPVTGVITAVADGDCRIGCRATYQGVVTAEDSSYLAVNAVVIVMDYDLTQETIPADVKANRSNRYARASGDILVPTESSAPVAPLEYVGTTPQGRRVVAANRTHIFINNNLTTASPWLKTNLTVTASTINSPVGTTANTYKLTPSTTSGQHILSAVNTASDITAGKHWAASVFLKPDGITKVKLKLTSGDEINEGTYDLVAGTFTGADANIIDMGNGWYRVILHKVTVAKQASITYEIIALNASGSDTFAGDGTAGLIAWVPQLEMGDMTNPVWAGTPFVCSYARDTTSAVTFTIPKNGHTGVDIYHTDGTVQREVFTGTATTWMLTFTAASADWGSKFITGLKYYD